MVNLQNITVVKHGQKLFQNFTFEFKKGEHYVISGSNGSGKTTLLELIAGHIHAAHGDVVLDFINGATWEERYWERKRKVHYIPAHAIQQFLKSSNELYYQQRYYTDGEPTGLTVRDVLGNDLAGLSELNLPSNLDVQHLLSVEIIRLSNGQLKKILLLQSLLKERPAMLLLDYPFEGLDIISREELSDFIVYITRMYSIQIILVDHHHHLPVIISKRLVLENFSLLRLEDVSICNPDPDPVISDREVVLVTDTVKPDPEVVVEIKDLKIQYGDNTILSNFNWKILKGERWALTGRNGSGKTTVFSLIYADHPMAYSQQVYLFGKKRGSGESIWDIKKRISYIGPELISYLNPKSIIGSARQYIYSISRNLDVGKLADLIHYFQAEKFIDIPVRFLSSGQLQLMVVLNSFLSDKELLLMDEPFQFLDPLQQERMAHYLQKHLHTNTTLVMITHYEKDSMTWTQQTKRIL